MPKWLLQIGFSWGFSWAISFVGQQARKDQALIAALNKYRDGGTFLEIAWAYSQMTPEATDDQIVESIEQFKRDLTVVPFNQLVRENQVLIMIGETRIPDFDDDPANDRPVSGLLGEIVDKTLEQKDS